MSETQKMQAGCFVKIINVILNECKKQEDEFFNIAAKWMSQTFLRYLNVIIGIIFFYQFRPGQFEMLSNDIFRSSDYRKYENAPIFSVRIQENRSLFGLTLITWMLVIHEVFSLSLFLVDEQTRNLKLDFKLICIEIMKVHLKNKFSLSSPATGKIISKKKRPSSPCHTSERTNGYDAKRGAIFKALNGKIFLSVSICTSFQY